MHEDHCVIHIVDKLKQSRPGFKQPQLKFFKFSDADLCVVLYLKEYISKTEPLCSSDNLFICVQKPHNPASKDTIARWMKTLLVSAGITEFAPHSFRGAASSAMFRCGVPLGTILKTAGWSRAQTFQRFYNRPLTNPPEKDDSSPSLIFYSSPDNN